MVPNYWKKTRKRREPSLSLCAFSFWLFETKKKNFFKMEMFSCEVNDPLKEENEGFVLFFIHVLTLVFFYSGRSLREPAGIL